MKDEYAFEGVVIRLKQKDYERMENIYLKGCHERHNINKNYRPTTQ